MPSARQELLSYLGQPNCYSLRPAVLEPLQLAAARELFAQRREQVQVLARRAQDCGVGSIDQLDDLLPLLFSHTTYKSYPLSFIKQSQWERMTRWLATLSAVPVTGINLDGVVDVDDWVDRLWEAGHLVNTTSGTSGKVSFLNRTHGDDLLLRRCLEVGTCWPQPIKPDNSRHFFFFGPRSGPYLLVISSNQSAELFGRPDSLHYLSNERMKLTSITSAAEMRLKMADGTATPDDIRQFDQAATQQVKERKGRFDEMARRVIELRREPLFLAGAWPQIWDVVQQARAAGVGDGEFHPDTVILSGGGAKGTSLPADFREVIMAFFGPVGTMQAYGMSEMSRGFPLCEAGNYHQVPWIIPFVLDSEGAKSIGPREGRHEGRFAYLDLSNEARWNGLITGDRVTVDFSGHCNCGRDGLVVLPNISRYANLGEEDKIGCAGTIESYIRGSMAQ